MGPEMQSRPCIFFLDVNIIDGVVWTCCSYAELVPCFSSRPEMNLQLDGEENLGGFDCSLIPAHFHQ